MKTLLEWTDEKNIDMEVWSEPEAFAVVEGNEPGKVNLVFDGCRVMRGDSDTPTPDSDRDRDRELEDALRERKWEEAMRQWRNKMARMDEREAPEEPKRAKGINPMSPAQRTLENVRKARENAEEPMDCAEQKLLEILDSLLEIGNSNNETLEEPMDCAECGHKAEVTQYSAFALTSDEIWECNCANEDCPEPVVRCSTRKEALDGWNQRQNWKREQQAKRAKGGNHLRKGDGERKAAPWGDLSGGAIHEGDRVHAENKGDGTVIYCSTEPGQPNAWLVEWDTGKVDLLKNVLQRLKKEAAKPKTAPVQDFYGQEIREGDTIRHPNGVEGIVFEGVRMWAVEYEDAWMPRSLESRVSPYCKGVVVKRAEVKQ